MEPTSLRIPATDDLSLHALEWSREGVPMLLLHGFGNEAHLWDEFAPTVSDHYRVVALSLRGHGDSDWDPGHRYDYDAHVGDLMAVVDHLGIERMVLVGFSLGGRISMLYAGLQPEKLAGLVIVDSAPELDLRGTTRIRMEVAEHRDPAFASVSEYETILAHNYPAASPDAIRHMAKHALKQRDDGKWVLKMDTAYRGVGGPQLGADEMMAREEENVKRMWAALETLACPALVVRGAASDIMSPEVADRMVDEVIPEASLAVVPQAAHSVMTDNPSGFNEAVAKFALG
jgi:pimeloyl-ACP methyl ester carboxylesterase